MTFVVPVAIVIVSAACLINVFAGPEAHVDRLKLLRQRVQVLIKHMQKRYPNHKCTHRLATEWADAHLQLLPTHGRAGQTVDKRIIQLCLYDTYGRLLDVNTSTFVLLHELAHVCTTEVGHTDAFWKTFKFLIHCAMEARVYMYTDYDIFPETYCGEKVAMNPYTCVLNKSCTLF